MAILPDWLLNGGGGGGLFANRWAPVPDAINAGTWDPQGQNFNPVMMAPPLTAPTNAMAQAGPLPIARPDVGMPQPPMSLEPPMPGGVAPAGGGDFFDRLNRGLANNSNMLIGLGGDIMSGGFRSPLRGALAGAKMDREQFGATDDIKEYQFAKSQGFKGTLQDWIQRKRAGAGEYGLTPIWGTDADGNPAFIQPGKSGEAVQGKLPPGFKIARDPIKVDAGTHFILMDPQTRQPVGSVPKDVEGKGAAEARGTERGKAQINLPTVLAKTDQSIKMIDDLISHPGRETATGLSGQFDPRNYIRGTDAKNFSIRTKQLQGRAFLEAFENLKGGGAISEVEGAKAEQAIARLDTAQSDEEYLTALRELRDILLIGKQNAMIKAGMLPNPQGAKTGATQRIQLEPE